MKLVIFLFMISILPTYTKKMDCYKCSSSWKATVEEFKSCITGPPPEKLDNCVTAASYITGTRGICTVRIDENEISRDCQLIKPNTSLTYDFPNKDGCRVATLSNGVEYQFCSCTKDKCNGYTEFTYGPQAVTTTTPGPPKPYKRGCVNGSSSLNKYDNIYIMGFIAAAVMLASIVIYK